MSKTKYCSFNGMPKNLQIKEQV